MAQLDLSRAVNSEGKLGGAVIIGTLSKLEKLHMPNWHLENVKFLASLNNITDLNLRDNKLKDVFNSVS